MNKAFNRKGKESFSTAYPNADFEFNSLKFGRSKKKEMKELRRLSGVFNTYATRSYL